MGNNFTKLLKILFFVLIFSIFFYNSFSYLDPDLGWHLKAGEEIYLNKSVPWQENYNYTLDNRTWVDHEWLPNLIAYLLFIKLGYISLNIFFALIGVLIFFLLNACLLKKYIKDGLHYLLILIIEILGLVAILPHSGVRVQMLSVLMLLLELIIIDKFQTTKNHKLLYYLPLLFFIWVNLHGGFLIGLVILWFYLFVGLLAPKIIRLFKINFLKTPSMEKKDFCYVFLFAFFSCLAVLITPYHYHYFAFMSSYANTFYLTHISEWLPIYSAPIFYTQQIYLLVFISILIINFINKKQQKIDLWQFALSLLLFFSAFRARRNFPLFFIASLPLIALATSTFNANNFKTIFRFINYKYLKINLIFTFLLCIFLFILSANATDAPFSNHLFCRSYPCAALKKIKSLPQADIRIFNDYGSGGYLVWNWPEKKIFIDGRLPMLDFNGHSFLEEYYEFFDKEKIPEKLNMYGINLVLGKKARPIKFNWFEKTFLGLKDNNKKNLLEEYLSENNEWQEFFTDNNFFVYQKIVYNNSNQEDI